MWYLTVLAVAVAAVGAWFFFKKASPTGDLDVNKDGKVNVDDVKAVADVNKDGKVTEADAKAAVAEVKAAAVEVRKVAEAEVTKTVAKAKKTATAGVKKAVTKAKK